MNPNPKIESYLDCGHELVCKPRASTTAGPTDGAARDSVARGTGGRTCRGDSPARGRARPAGLAGTHAAAAGGARARAQRTRQLAVPTPRPPAHAAGPAPVLQRAARGCKPVAPSSPAHEAPTAAAPGAVRPGPVQQLPAA